ncbi:MAG: sugar ABC transporter substrate-binding protein [Gudongella sp.]|nr:sugar ABC transporter substrate-binding protein [Gudongella sp.]
MLKKSSLFRMLVIVISISMVLVGCTTGTSTSEEPTFKIGINSFGQANFFARIGKATLEKTIEELGGEVIASVNADEPGRIASIENMIAQGVDAIIIQEGDINLLTSAIEQASAEGILIGSFDAGDNDMVDIFVESDNTKLGEESARQLVELMGEKGNVVEIYNDAGSMIRARKDAAHSVFDEYPNVQITDSFVYTWPDYFPDVKSKMESILQANPNPGDISGVFATFDGVGIAAASAIWEAGLEQSISIVGVDGDPEAYEEMKKEGSPFKATMAQDPETMAKIVVEQMFELLKGNEIAEKHIYVPGILITKDNIPDTK